MPADLRELLDDLAGETTATRGLVSDLDAAGWLTPTPAPGWTVADQISHLAFFDDAAITAATDPDRFATEFSGEATAAGSPDDIAARYRDLAGSQLLSWFDSSRGQLIEVFASTDPGHRMPWFGPPMSAASAVTARIMETWAHGQDIADGLGVPHPPSGRLRHVAYLGIRAMPFSFASRGQPAPEEAVRIELTGPGGEQWAWGPPTAASRVTGPALGFCLLVTRRRHRADTGVIARGAVADRWLDIAQAFAGPPGAGREPGQRFPHAAAGEEKG